MKVRSFAFLYLTSPLFSIQGFRVEIQRLR